MARVARQLLSFEEYTRIEQASPVRHEYLDGTVWAMAGGTPDHAAICANVTTLLSTQLRGRTCRVFGSDLRIRVKATGLTTYPGASVVCGKLALDSEDPTRTTVTNPRVVVEVLSPSTARYDRGEKLEHYKRMTSLEEIVFVAHDERLVEVWRRSKTGWRRHAARTGSATLSSLGCELQLDEVYRNPLEGS